MDLREIHDVETASPASAEGPVAVESQVGLIPNAVAGLAESTPGLAALRLEGDFPDPPLDVLAGLVRAITRRCGHDCAGELVAPLNAGHSHAEVFEVVVARVMAPGHLAGDAFEVHVDDAFPGCARTPGSNPEEIQKHVA